MSQLFAWGGQSTGVSALASVLPMNTQDWYPLRWTGWISLQSKGLSRVFSNTTVQKHHLIFSLFNVSFSPAEAQGTYQEAWCIHFCKVPSLSLSGSSFLGPCWNRVDGNEMGKFWHHWLTWCSCSLLLVQMDWSEIPPEWHVFLLWGILVIIPDIHKLGIPNAIVSFLIRGNVLVPTAHHLQSSPQPLFPSLCKHHLEKIK